MNSFFLRKHFFGLICVAAGDVSKILEVKKSVYTFILSIYSWYAIYMSVKEKFNLNGTMKDFVLGWMHSQLHVWPLLFPAEICNYFWA